MISLNENNNLFSIIPYFGFENNRIQTSDYFPNITEVEESNYAGNNPVVEDIRKNIDRADGTTRFGKNMFCRTCSQSAIKMAKKTVKSRGQQLTDEDVTEIKEICHTGCDKIQYKLKFVQKIIPEIAAGRIRPDRRRNNCHKFVDNQITKIGAKFAGTGLEGGSAGMASAAKAAEEAQAVFDEAGVDITQPQAETNTTPIIIGGVVLLIIIVLVIILIARRKKKNV